jgi:NADH-quinone oxidoreductase subunit M
LPKGNNELIKRVAIVATSVIAIASIFLATGFDKAQTGFQYVQSNSWISAFKINFAVGIDGISLVLILLSTILVPIVVLATWNEADTGRWSSKTFYILILVLETMMIGVFAATDLFLFYVFFEAMLIPVYFLIGGFGSGEKCSSQRLSFLLTVLFGGLLMLASIIGIYVIAGNQIGATFDVTQLATLQIDSRTENLLFLGFFVAFAIKAPLVPFHTWLPDAAKSATPGTSVLLLGVLDKVGTYGMIRFCIALFPDASKTFTPLIIVLSVISILYGAFMAIGQRDIKGLIAFTSISHFGFITMGIFAMTSQGMSGATLTWLTMVSLPLHCS